MSNTANDGIDAEKAARLAHAVDADQTNLPIGVYGEGKYGECRTPTKKEIAAAADTPGRTFESDTESGLYRVGVEKAEA